jgi:hypothetical protein
MCCVNNIVVIFQFIYSTKIKRKVKKVMPHSPKSMSRNPKFVPYSPKACHTVRKLRCVLQISG